MFSFVSTGLYSDSQAHLTRITCKYNTSKVLSSVQREQSPKLIKPVSDECDSLRRDSSRRNFIY